MCAYYYNPHPQVFALHPIDQPPIHHPQWPPQQIHQAINGHRLPNSTAPPLAYYYSSPRNSDDSSHEDGPTRGRPSYLQRNFSSNYREKSRQTTDLLFLLVFLLFFGFLVSIASTLTPVFPFLNRSFFSRVTLTSTRLYFERAIRTCFCMDTTIGATFAARGTSAFRTSLIPGKICSRSLTFYSIQRPIT